MAYINPSNLYTSTKGSILRKLYKVGGGYIFLVQKYGGLPYIEYRKPRTMFQRLTGKGKLDSREIDAALEAMENSPNI